MKRFVAMLLILVLIGIPNTVSAGSSIKIQYSGKTFNYTGTQLNVTYNGIKINQSKTPGILINQVGMLSYEDIFVNSDMKAKASYNKNSKKIIIKNGKNSIVMKIGSKTAIVNGKTKKMPSAPIHVKYIASGKTKILVPARFVAENLGFLYAWYSNTDTVAIEKKGLLLEYNKKQYNYRGSEIAFYVDGGKITTELPGIISGGYTLAPAKEVFQDSKLKVQYTYDSVKNILTLSSNDTKIQLTIGSKNARINGESVLLPTAPLKVLYQKNKQTYLMVPAEYIAEQLGFYYEYDVAKKSASIYSENPGKEGELKDAPNEIRINKGSNTLSNLTLKDDYSNRKYIITLPGDQVAYYIGNPLVIEDNGRVTTNISLNTQGNTEITLKTDIIRGFNVIETGTDFVVTIQAPKAIYSKIIYLDAGHGGIAPGTVGTLYGNSLIEKNITLSIVRKIQEASNKAASNIKIYYSRLDDNSVSNAERAKMANEIEADIFISIHINATQDRSVRGSEVMYSAKLDQQAQSALTSSRLAYFMKNYLVKSVGSEERSITRGNIEVLNSTLMPSALLEVAYISNEEDVDILMEDARITKIAEGIYKGIEDILLKYPPKR